MKLPPGKMFQGSRGPEWQTDCPSCGKLKFYWNVKRKAGHCKSTDCGLIVRGERRFERLFQVRLQMVDPRLEDLLEEAPAYREAASDRVPAWAVGKARNYLQMRGIDEVTSSLVPIEYSEREHRLYFPIQPLTTENEMSWYRRSLGSTGVRWMGLGGLDKDRYVFGLDALSPHRTRVGLLEGIMDVLSPDLYGYAISLLGSVISDTLCAWLRNRGFTPVVWADSDAAGQAGAAKIRDALHGWGVNCVVYTPSTEDVISKARYLRVNPDDIDPGCFAPHDRAVQQFIELLEE